MALAWEMLELARLIYNNNGGAAAHANKLADCHLYIGDILAEQVNRGGPNATGVSSQTSWFSNITCHCIICNGRAAAYYFCVDYFCLMTVRVVRKPFQHCHSSPGPSRAVWRWDPSAGEV